MRLLQTLSLKSKLIIPIITFTCLIFILSQGFAAISAYSTQKQNLIERVSVLAKGVAYNLQAAILFDDSLTAAEVLSAFSADNDVVRVKLYSADSTLFAMFENQEVPAPVPTETQRKEIVEKAFSVGDEFIFLRVPVDIEGETIANLRVTISKDSFQAIYDRVLRSSLVFLLVMIGSGMVLYMTVEKYIVGPVYQLNLAMRAYIDRQQQSIDIEAVTNDEIGDLVRAFNTMLQRLGQRDRQVAFTLGKLEEEKSFADEVVESVKHALIVTDHNGDIIHFNAATCDVFRCTSAFLKGANINDIVISDEIDLIKERAEQSKDLKNRKVWIKDVFNNRQLLNINGTKLTKPGQSLFSIEDITEENSAQRRQKLAADVFENSQDGLLVMGDNQRITMANPSVTRLLGYSWEFLLGKRPEQVFEWQQFSSIMPTIKDAVDNFGIWQGEVWEQHQLGQKVPLFVKVSRILSSESSTSYDYVYILSDLSSIKEMERLEYLAHHDTLTGLANRAKLYRVLDEALKDERQEKFGHAVLYLDLDGFKKVNDTYGHDAGDEVLKQVSERLLSQVRSQDLVARLSGDEFVVFMNSTDRESTHVLADRLVALIQQDIVYQGRAVNVGVSIGVHFVEDNQETLDEILKAADSAMYRAKSQGKGQVVIDH